MDNVSAPLVQLPVTLVQLPVTIVQLPVTNRPLARIEGVESRKNVSSDARFDNFLTRNDFILSVA